MAAKKKAKVKTKPARGSRKRRGNGKDFTGGKENEVEVRSIGDNSGLNLPAPDDFEHHYKSIRGAQDKVKTAQAISSQASESANKCSPGLAKVIKDTLKIENENDPVKLQRHLEMMGMGLSHIGSTIQISIFDSLAGDEDDLVAKRGYADGKAARPSNNRYPSGSSLAEIYDTNWAKGQAENMAAITQAPQNGEAQTAH